MSAPDPVDPSEREALLDRIAQLQNLRRTISDEHALDAIDGLVSEIEKLLVQWSRYEEALASRLGAAG